MKESLESMQEDPETTAHTGTSPISSQDNVTIHATEEEISSLD